MHLPEKYRNPDYLKKLTRGKAVDYGDSHVFFDGDWVIKAFPDLNYNHVNIYRNLTDRAQNINGHHLTESGILYSVRVTPILHVAPGATDPFQAYTVSPRERNGGTNLIGEKFGLVVRDINRLLNVVLPYENIYIIEYNTKRLKDILVAVTDIASSIIGLMYELREY